MTLSRRDEPTEYFSEVLDAITKAPHGDDDAEEASRREVSSCDMFRLFLI